MIKDAPAEILLQGIRAVAQGDALLAPNVTRRLLDRFVAAHPHIDQQTAADLATLTDREHKVLRLSPAACPTTRSLAPCSWATPP